MPRPLRPWPAWEEEGGPAERVRARCRDLVADLSRDPAVLERLARACAEAAGEGYLAGAWRVVGGMPPVYEDPGLYWAGRRP